MNRPIVRLYGLVAVLFALLVAFTSRWTIFEASSLRENPLNKRTLLREERTPRGAIVAADGTVLARSVRGAASSPEGEGVYQRVYPTGELFAAPIGYDYIDPDLGSAGLERFRNRELSGEQDDGDLQSVLDQLQGKEPQGEKVITTLVPSAQRAAVRALGEHDGAVVAIEPRSGAVEVMASKPSYDPNALRSPAGKLAQAREMHASPPTRSEVNRVTQFGYAPGSSFKIVTATAAIDTGAYTPESMVAGPDGLVVSGVPLHNDNDASFGPVTLTYALAHSINTVYAQVAEHVGKRTLGRYMERFGFDRKPQLDYPAREMSVSGEHEGEAIVAPTSPRVDLGRMGIGQDKLEVTPLQMAEVAASVADGGRLMVPHLTQADRQRRRHHRADDLPAGAVGRDEALHRSGVDGDDGSGRQGRHRHRRGDPRHPGGGQDGHRPDAVRRLDQQRVVHRLRPRLRPAGGARGDARGGAGGRRHVRRAGGQGRDRKPARGWRVTRR